MTITLSGKGLLYKSGFGDGDMLDDILDDAGLEALDERPDHEHLWGYQEVLAELVEERLLPAVRATGIDVEAYRIGTIHNPIRIVGAPDLSRAEAIGAISIDIEDADVIAKARDVMKRREERARALVAE